MKVLFVLDQLRDGGAQAQARDLARGLVEKGVACPVATIFPDPDVGAADGVVASALAGSRSARSLPLACVRLHRLIRRVRPDVVHTHLEPADLVGRLACATAGVPHASTAHSLRPWHWRRRFGVFFERRTSSLTRGYVAVSEAVAAMLRDEFRIKPDRIRVIPNWVPPTPPPLATEPAPPGGRPTIVHVARLDVPKRQEILIHAFREVRRAFPNAVLWIAGKGPEERRLRALAGEGVEFLGHRSDVRALLRQGDLFALSSQWEGMPISVLEAMDEGVPVVSTAVGGVPELIEDGISGWLVPKGDASALAASMVAALRNPDRARQVGAEGRRRVAGRRERALDSYLQFYEDLRRRR